MTTPSTLTELLEAAAEALQERDGDKIEQLQNHARGWLVDAATSAAILTTLGAMAEAAYELESFQAA